MILAWCLHMAPWSRSTSPFRLLLSCVHPCILKYSFTHSSLFSPEISSPSLWLPSLTIIDSSTLARPTVSQLPMAQLGLTCSISPSWKSMQNSQSRLATMYRFYGISPSVYLLFIFSGERSMLQMRILTSMRLMMLAFSRCLSAEMYLNYGEMQVSQSYSLVSSSQLQLQLPCLHKWYSDYTSYARPMYSLAASNKLSIINPTSFLSELTFSFTSAAFSPSSMSKDTSLLLTIMARNSFRDSAIIFLIVLRCGLIASMNLSKAILRLVCATLQNRFKQKQNSTQLATFLHFLRFFLPRLKRTPDLRLEVLRQKESVLGAGLGQGGQPCCMYMGKGTGTYIGVCCMLTGGIDLFLIIVSSTSLSNRPNFYFCSSFRVYRFDLISFLKLLISRLTSLMPLEKVSSLASVLCLRRWRCLTRKCTSGSGGQLNCSWYFQRVDSYAIGYVVRQVEWMTGKRRPISWLLFLRI